MSKEKKEKSYIAESEKTIIGICKAHDDILKVVDAFRSFGFNYIHRESAKDDFWRGLSLIRKSIASNLQYHISRLFTFSAVGGEASKEYSLAMLEKAFSKDDKHVIIDYLDKRGAVPGSWKSATEECFRNEVNEKIKEVKKGKK